MKQRIRRIVGAVVLVIACLWMILAQGRIWSLPHAMASDALGHHFPGRDTLTASEAFDLCFVMADDIVDRSPNVLFPAALLLIGSWLFFGTRREAKGKESPRVSPDESLR